MSDWLLLVLVTVPLHVGELLALGEVALDRRDISRLRRVAWFVILLAVPYVSLAVYIVVRPPRGFPMAGPTSAADERAVALVLAAERHARGELSDAEYDDVVASATTQSSV